MNPLSLLRFWREAVILALAAIAALYAHAAHKAEARVVEIRAEDSALANEQELKNKAQRQHDRQEAQEAQNALKIQLDQLHNDPRIAHGVYAHPSCPRAVPRAAVAASGAAPENPVDVSPTPAGNPQPDLGPAIDTLTRECDALATRNSVLIDWVMRTR